MSRCKRSFYRQLFRAHPRHRLMRLEGSKGPPTTGAHYALCSCGRMFYGVSYHDARKTWAKHSIRRWYRPGV